MEIPDYVISVARVLITEGYEAYLVGGPIRDVLLERHPHDYDIATNARPDQVLSSFPKAISTGARFGNIVVLSRGADGENHNVDVTTFRSEEQYTDGRWPSKVKFEDDIETDLSRRDFTMNALAVDLKTIIADSRDRADKPVNPVDGVTRIDCGILDPFGGIPDIASRVVRAVGAPIERFTEDGLRPFRACRFASMLGFEIEESTFKAIEKTLPVCRMVSMERVRDEFTKMILGSPKPSVGIELMRKSGLLEIFLPELIGTVGVAQPNFHTDDVYWHLLRCLDIAEDRVKLAALFHDIGKPQKAMPDGHFYGHDIESERVTREVMKRMRFSNAEIKHTTSLVRNHMFYYPHDYDDMLNESGTIESEGSKEFKFWSDSAVRRFLRRVGPDLVDDLFALRIADATSNKKSIFDPEEIKALQRRISDVRKKDMALTVEDLAIDGNDLMKELGMKPSPIMGSILRKLLKLVIEDPKLNNQEFLLNEARKLFQVEAESK